MILFSLDICYALVTQNGGFETGISIEIVIYMRGETICADYADNTMVPIEIIHSAVHMERWSGIARKGKGEYVYD